MTDDQWATDLSFGKFRMAMPVMGHPIHFMFGSRDGIFRVNRLKDAISSSI